LDGAGISTQSSLLCQWLEAQGYPYHLTKEPSQGPAGAQIRLALAKRLGSLSTEGFKVGVDELSLALLFAADRADHLAGEVMPLLQRGVNVVTDRYLLSSYAYQGVHVDLDWFEAVNAFFPFPDLTVFLDVPPQLCMARITASRWHTEKNEGEAELAAVRSCFEEAIHRFRVNGANVFVVEHCNGATVEEVHSRIAREVIRLPLRGPDQPQLQIQ